MDFSVYWIAVSLELWYITGSTAKVTKPPFLNTTAGCSSGNQSLAKCGVHAATKIKMKYHRRQMYSTPVGFTYPKVPNSYEIDMGYSPNVGFEPYWPGTTRIGTTRRDYKVCGVICPSMYINYGPVCGINKHQVYKSFISYCDMRNEDCVGASGWRSVYKGECYNFIRTYPTKSSDIRKRISSYITEYFKRTPTIRQHRTDEHDRRKFGPPDPEYSSDRDDAGSRDGIQGGQSNNGRVRSKLRQRLYRGNLHGRVGNRNGPGRKGRGQNSHSRKGRKQKVLGQNVVGQSGKIRKGLREKGQSQKRRSIQDQSRKRFDQHKGHKDKNGACQRRKRSIGLNLYQRSLVENAQDHNVKSQKIVEQNDHRRKKSGIYDQRPLDIVRNIVSNNDSGPGRNDTDQNVQRREESVEYSSFQSITVKHGQNDTSLKVSHQNYTGQKDQGREEPDGNVETKVK